MNRARETSLEAYRDVRARLGERQRSVLLVLETAQAPLCDREIAAILRWPINCVTPRRGELVDLGLVEDAGKMKYAGRMRHFWRAVTDRLFPVPDIGRPRK